MQMQSLERRREGRGGGPVPEGHLTTCKSTLSYCKRSRPYRKAFLLASIAAALLLLVVHGQREKRVLGSLLEDHEQELNSLRVQLQKEKEISEAMKRKIEELTGTARSLKYQKMELTEKLTLAENVAAYLQQRQTEMEFEQYSSLSEIRTLRKVELEFTKAKTEIILLKSDLERNREKIELLRNHLEFLSSKQENGTVVGSGINTDEILSSNLVERGKGQNDGQQNGTVVGSGINMNETLSGGAIEHGVGQKNATVVVRGILVNETVSSDAVEFGKVQYDEQQGATVAGSVMHANETLLSNVIEHGEPRYDEWQNATTVESNVRMNETLANVVEHGKAQYDEQQNATVLHSGIHMSDIISINVAEHGEARYDGQQSTDVNLKEKPMVNETLIYEGEEQRDGPPMEGEWVKADSHAEGDGANKENIEKEAIKPKQIEESVIQGMGVENKEQMGRQADGDGRVQVAEDLSLPNKSGGREPRNSTYVRPEISGHYRHGQNLEVANENGMGQEYGSKAKEEHAGPVKKKRRRREMLPKRKLLRVTVTDSRKEADGNGHPNDEKSLEGIGETVQAVANRENCMTSNVGETKGEVSDVQSGITSDGGRMIELGHGNERSPTGEDSLRRRIQEDASTTMSDSGIDREDGKNKEQLGYSAVNAIIPSGLSELAAYDN